VGYTADVLGKRAASIFKVKVREQVIVLAHGPLHPKQGPPTFQRCQFATKESLKKHHDNLK
jgi:hypothetical protein